MMDNKFRRRKYVKSNAMTLVEIIMAMALIGIITISIMTLLTSGFTQITSSGERAKALFQAQAQIESDINDIGQSASDASETLTLKIDDTEIIVPGKVKSVNTALPNGRFVQIEIFQPYK